MFNIKDYTYDKYLDGECGVLDAHCHVGLMPESGLYASAITGFEVISCGTLPSQFERDAMIAGENVCVGLGFHPRDVNPENQKEELTKFCNIFEEHDPQIIGEIGLDFSDKFVATEDLQIETFREICRMLANKDGKILSIHAIKSADIVLDILEEEGLLGGASTSTAQSKNSQASKNDPRSKNSQCSKNAQRSKNSQGSKNAPRNAIIFHWFSDSGDALNRAKNFGALFSVGPKMLATRRGHDYIRQIPEDQLLIETDLPWDNEPLTPTEHFNILNDFLIELRDTRGY